MKCAYRLGLIAAALGLLAGCSGTYQVGSDLANAGAPSQAGTPTSQPGGSSGANGGVFAAGGSGGSYAAAGATSAAGTSFCGYQLPKDSAIDFAPPAVVARRVFKFLFDLDEPPAMSLPSETTREWAGELAATALASSSTPSVKGMDRFVENWWTGTPTPKFWAAHFSSRQGTLVDLLTTNAVLPNGAGLLTDPAVVGTESTSGRGRFVLEHLTGVTMPPPDPSFSTRPALMPGQTRRAQLEGLVARQPCKGCHDVMDPYGYPLGNFGSDGSFQTLENGSPIDTTATLVFNYSGGLGVLSGTPEVHDAQSMGNALANTCEVAFWLSHELLHDATRSAGLPTEASDATVALTAAQFTASGLSLPALVRRVVESDTFLSAD